MNVRFGREGWLQGMTWLGALRPELVDERTRFARGGGVDVEVDAQLMHFI
jgi:hypothetical protein